MLTSLTQTTWKHTAWINLTHKYEVAICLIVHCVLFTQEQMWPCGSPHARTHTHLTFIIRPLLQRNCCQTLVVPLAASTVIDYQTEFLLFQHCVSTHVEAIVFYVFACHGEVKKNEMAVYLHILHMLEWALLCDMKYACVFLMSDSQISPYNDVSQTMWSLTDVVAAVNLGVASPACAVMVEFISFFVLSASLVRYFQLHERNVGEVKRNSYVGSFKSLN